MTYDFDTLQEMAYGSGQFSLLTEDDGLQLKGRATYKVLTDDGRLLMRTMDLRKVHDFVVQAMESAADARAKAQKPWPRPDHTNPRLPDGYYR